MEPNAKPSRSSRASLNPMHALKNFTYNPRVMGVARTLHLTKMLRKCYQWATGGRNNILRVKLGKSHSLFHVRNPLEYRTTEQCFIGYERDFIDVLLASCGEGGIFLDIGANIGQFTVPIAREVGSGGVVIAVEPEVNARKRLDANLKLNGLSNVRILGMALGAESGQGRLAWDEGTCPSLTQGASKTSDTGAGPMSVAESGVEIVKIEVGDQVLGRQHLPIPNAVKIDVEGFEYQVILGLRQSLKNPACKLICCEIHPAFLPSGTNSQMVVEEVKSLGFSNVVLNERSGQIHMIARKNG
jgi:FkbM family methyltransferase